MRFIAAACLAAGFLVIPAGARQDPKLADLRSTFTATLQRIATGLDGVMSYAIVDLTTGDRIERMPDATFATASTIKLSILYELFKQAEEGRLALDEVRPLDRRHAVGGSGVLSQLTTPALSLRDYATLMIILSDNTATNVVIDAVGMKNVTDRMAGLGLKETKLRRRMIDAEAARRGDENVSTAGELARLLEVLHTGEGLSKGRQEQLLENPEEAQDHADPSWSAGRHRSRQQKRIAGRHPGGCRYRVRAGPALRVRGHDRVPETSQ